MKEFTTEAKRTFFRWRAASSQVSLWAHSSQLSLENRNTPPYSILFIHFFFLAMKFLARNFQCNPKRAVIDSCFKTINQQPSLDTVYPVSSYLKTKRTSYWTTKNEHLANSAPVHLPGSSMQPGGGLMYQLGAQALQLMRPRFEFKVHYFPPWISKKIMLLSHRLVLSVSRSK